MYYLKKFYSNPHEAIEVHETAMKILHDLEDGLTRDKLQEDIWDIEDYINECAKEVYGENS